MAAVTITGLFKDRDAAECGFDAAIARGYEQKDVNLVMSEETRARSFPADQPVGTELADKVANTTTVEGLEGGALGGPLGGTVGTIAPVVAAVGVATLLPGLGLVLAGPVAAAVAAAGAVAIAGGLLGVIANWGIPKERIEQLETGIRNGGILMGLSPRSPEDAAWLTRQWQLCGAAHVHP